MIYADLLCCVLCRDDLYRVELDNMAGDEMFYSKVRLILLHPPNTKPKMHSKLITHTRSYQIHPDCGSFLRQKRTWESNKNDIRVCRMKGKHEVQCSCTTTLWLWEALSRASTLSTPSHAWTDTTAVGETLFPLGAPAYGIYTNLILLIQNQRRLITRAQWNVTRAERCPQKHESRFSCTSALWQFFFIYLVCSLQGGKTGKWNNYCVCAERSLTVFWDMKGNVIKTATKKERILMGR